MELKVPFFLALVAVFGPFLLEAALDQAEEDNAKEFLAKYNSITPQEDYKSTVASWNHATNLTDYNKALKTNASLAFSAFYKKMQTNASVFDTSKLSYDTARQIKRITASATPKDEETLKKLTMLESLMEEIYSTGKVEDSNGD